MISVLFLKIAEELSVDCSNSFKLAKGKNPVGKYLVVLQLNHVL